MKIKLEYHGETKTLDEWAKPLGISGGALDRRFCRMWPATLAVTTPKGVRLKTALEHRDANGEFRRTP